MYRIRRIALHVGVALAFALVIGGCRAARPGDQAADVEAEVSVEEQTVPEEAPDTDLSDLVEEPPTEDQEDSVAEPVEVIDLDQLDSYRQRVTWVITEGDTVEEWSFLIEFVNDPPAQRSVWHGVDREGNELDWEMIQIGTTTYMRLSGEGDEDQWMVVSSEDNAPPTQQLTQVDLRTPDQYLASGHCENRGRDTVEGQSAVHYVCSREAITDDLLALFEGNTMTDAGLEFWISTQNNVQVRSITWWEGLNEDKEPVSWRWEQTVWAINEPITIEAPEGVAAPGLPDDVPLVPGARITSAITGMVAFEVEAELDEAREFLLEEMPNNGWRLEAEYGDVLTFVKGGRQVMIMLTQENGTLSGFYVLSD